MDIKILVHNLSLINWLHNGSSYSDRIFNSFEEFVTAENMFQCVRVPTREHIPELVHST